jgi:hypothetical protein
MPVEIPEPGMTDYGRAQFATEIAFGALLRQAESMGLEVVPVMGLMYLPTQDLTRRFQEACRDILLALTPAKTHVIGADGKEHWVGEDLG